jgi:hypothetical protein
MGAKLDGPGIAWSCLERENSKVVLDMAEKYRSIESLFHRPKHHRGFVLCVHH